jgi:hypothetical protein
MSEISMNDNACPEHDDVSHTVVVDGVRQVYRIAGSGPVCPVHSGAPACTRTTCVFPLSNST